MDTNQSPFTDVDLTIEDYRPFSVLSLVSLLLSVFLGLMVVINPNLFAGSLAAAVLAGFILIWLRPKKQNLSGYKLAAVALFIALFATFSSLAYRQFRIWHLQNTAVAFGEKWLDLAKQGRVHELYQMSLEYNKRAKVGSSLVEKYGTLTSPGVELEMYLKQEPEASLRKDGDQATLSTIAVSYKKGLIYKEEFIVGYKYDRPGGEPWLFSLYLMRMDYPTPPGPQWYVYGVVNHNPSIPRQLTQQQTGVESMQDEPATVQDPARQ
ncbi:MAG: hypothetical protein P8K79_08270 [Mariniblastus sp.]|nr:hypothetical protein [Mariniblastus sp.]